MAIERFEEEDFFIIDGLPSVSKLRIEDGSSPTLALRSYCSLYYVYITELNLAADCQIWRAIQSTTGATKQFNPDWSLGWITTEAVKVLSDGKARKQIGTTKAPKDGYERHSMLLYGILYRLA